eukprot:1953705-Pyramimonas_sp.AAC.2
MTKSKDGIHWTPPVTLYEQAAEGNIPKVIANPPEVMSSGAWVLPFWYVDHLFRRPTFYHAFANPNNNN